MLSHSKIQQSFSRALASYDEAAIVQKTSANRLVKLLLKSGLKQSLDRVFEFGCGTGFLTEELSTRLHIRELIVNDLIAECEAYLNLRDIDSAKPQFLCGDIERVTIPQETELICSSSCVQWSQDLSTLLTRLTDAMVSKGWLALSSFTNGHFKELSQLQPESNVQIKRNYWTSENWQHELEKYYNIHAIQQEETVLWFDSVREVLLHLRLTGVNGDTNQTWNQRTLSDFENSYYRLFERDGKLPLTYRPIYIVAQKK